MAGRQQNLCALFVFDDRLCTFKDTVYFMANRKIHFALGLLILLAFSCSIVKDSDVTSLDQFNKLKLKSFEIIQTTLSGNSSALATLKYDSAVDGISGSTGAHVSRRQAFSFPALGSNKMKLKSGTTAATEIQIAYRDNGTPNIFIIYQGGVEVETYRFFYNANNQLIKLVSLFGPISNPTSVTKDTLIYAPVGGLLSSLIRNPKSPSPIPFTLDFGSSGSFGSWQGVKYNLGTQYCNNSNGNANVCGDFQKQVNGGQSNTNPLIFEQNQSTLGKTGQTTITDLRYGKGSPNSCDCSRELDTFYLHPLMILRDVVPQGSTLLWIYAVDWWKPGTAQIQLSNFTKNDVVQLNFNYAQ